MKSAVGSTARAGEVASVPPFVVSGNNSFPAEMYHVIDSLRGEPTMQQARHLAPPEVISISAALADPTRYRILELICGRDTVTSQALCDLLDLSPATMSHHLRLLRLASLVESIREGRWRHHKVRREILNGYVVVLSRLGT